MIKMTSSRPYLLRSLNEWIIDNDMTPHIVVDAFQKDVIVPREFVASGKIVLNVSPGAVHGLAIDNDFMSFSARFSGKAMDVIVPISAIMAIYAKENGQGMVFADEVTSTNQQTNASDVAVADLTAVDSTVTNAGQPQTGQPKTLAKEKLVEQRPSLKLVQ